MSFTPLEYRRALGLFATGITVVTTSHQAKFYGLTVNSFSSLSLEPPLVMVSLARASQTYNIISESGVYGVNVLSAAQQHLSERFARKDALGGKTFEDINLHIGLTGAPLFDEALTRLDCRVVSTVEAGDHTLFIGEVVALEQVELAEPEPLLYYHSSYHRLPGVKESQ